MPAIVPVIIGPTAVGKTALSLQIAKNIPVEIVSADSRQIYKYLDIGTAKAPLEIRRQIKHHMIDICEPGDYFSAGVYSAKSRKIIDDILKKGNLPLVVGGSGFYIQALVDGIFESQARDKTIRSELEKQLDEKGLSYLYSFLMQVDPDYAVKISSNDKQRIMRSLEVYRVTGRTFSSWHDEKPAAPRFEPLMIGLNMERTLLYERINERVEQMFDQGLVNEARQILDMGFDEKCNALNTVGYKEVIDCFKDLHSFEEAKELIKRNSRRYAKRQLTWFRRDERIKWYNVTCVEDIEKIADEIINEL